jgi:hypothetical protein
MAIAGLVVTAIVAFILVVLFISWFSNPPFGWGNAPAQPIDFPHTVHAGSVEEGGHAIQCEFCHRNVTKGDAATVPAVEQCLFCHKDISGRDSQAQTEIAKVQQYASDEEPIDWERVHRLPDHVRFVHEAHIRYFTSALDAEGLDGQRYDINGNEINRPYSIAETCSICHGDVGSMEEVQPKDGQSLKMGTCLDCHRENSVSTDCTVCHK